MTNFDKCSFTKYYISFNDFSTWMRRIGRSVLGGSQTWRVSFSLAEVTLAKSLTGPQRRCFLLIKFIFKDVIEQLACNDEKVFGMESAEAEDREFYLGSFSLNFHICK